MYYKILNRNLVAVVFFLLLHNFAFAQKFNIQRLSEINDNQKTISSIQKENVIKYLDEYGYDKRVIDLGNNRKAILKNVLNGLPQYMSTFNLQARKTTGVEQIKSNGLNLTGKGITIGVWDGGQIFQDHVEIAGRIVNKNGAGYSDHATHVSGTIIASGLNENAKGMVPEANIIGYYAFEDDLGPMAIEASKGLILSNHSYGLVLGWSYDPGSASWKWFGGSEGVDDRFGYYSSDSRTIDEIAYNAPYYTIVWAAGNDRSDVGDGSKASDGPYDILGPSAVAKNIITVGAITGFDNYVDQSSVVMSSFSSWGPTDDGRIKPDLVADGVNVLSLSSTGEESYTVKSGTSMASPNVTGTLAVLQEYYRQGADTFMTAAALKSLALHSAREAGTEGPDVQFGWGVLNALDAIEIIKNRNDKDTLLVEGTLLDQGIYEFELFSDGVTPITITLAWTDPAGSPGSAGNDNIMLKNDLDIRLLDDENLEVFPWMLDPTNYLVAMKGDNIRDNVEKIEFTDLEPRRYRLIVSHKNTLENLQQDFGLTITGGAIDTNLQNEFYWIASSGNLESENNWSLTSGGGSIMPTDFTDGTVVFDNNSILADGDIIKLNNDLSIENFIWLSDKDVSVDLNGFTLSITGQLKINQNLLSFSNGTIAYRSNNSQFVSLNFDGMNNCNVLIDVNNELTIESDINLNSLEILSGDVSIRDRDINLSKLKADVGSQLLLERNNIVIADSLLIKSDGIRSNNNSWKLNGVGIESLSEVSLDDIIEFNGISSISGSLEMEKVIIEESLHVTGYFSVDSLVLQENSLLTISGADTIEVKNYFNVLSTPSSITSIVGEESDLISILKLSFRKKLCFDNLAITNVSLISDAAISTGLNSTLINALNFQPVICDEILYPDFMVESNCSNSVITVNNLSEGSIDSYNWHFIDGGTVLNADDERAEVYYQEEGFYNIELNISNGSNNQSYSKEVEIYNNELEEVAIVENTSGLVSSKEGEAYQWYLDGEKLVGKTERNLEPNSSGSYQVVYYKVEHVCGNRISNPYEVVVTAFDNHVVGSPEVSISPNPFKHSFVIKGAEVNDKIFIYDVLGNVIFENIIKNESFQVDFLDDTFGVYFIKIYGKENVYQKRILKVK